MEHHCSTLLELVYPALGCGSVLFPIHCAPMCKGRLENAEPPKGLKWNKNKDNYIYR